MAKILLDIDANPELANVKISQLKLMIQSIGKEFSKINVNKGLTAQLNALSKALNAVAQNTTASANANLANAKAIERKTAALKNLVSTMNNAATTQTKLNTEAKKQENIDSQIATREAKLAMAREKHTQSMKNQIATIHQLKTANATMNENTSMSVTQTNELTKGFAHLESGASSSSKIIFDYSGKIKDFSANADMGLGSILRMAQGFLQWQLAATLVMKPIQAIQKAMDDLNETLVKTETTVVELQRVLPAHSATNSDMANKLYQIAQENGQSFENVSEIAENFAKAGYDWSETVDAVKGSIVALNVAELDAGEASTGLIAIMKQFKLEASEARNIIDMLNKVADNYSVTSEGLYQAIQRMGSAAANANTPLEQTIGLITGLSEATGRQGNNLGTALNALIQYSSKASSLDTFASLNQETADMVERFRMGAASIVDVWDEVSKVIENADARQSEILNNFAQNEDIINASEEIKGELGDIFELENQVYDTANTFRKNYFISFIGNMDTVAEATETAMNSMGYSIDEQAKYMDTYEAKVKSLTSEWQAFLNQEDGFLQIKKDWVEIGSGVLKVTNAIGGLKTILSATATILATMFGTKLINGFMVLSNWMKTTAFNTLNLKGNMNALNIAQEKESIAIAQAIGLRDQYNWHVAAGTVKVGELEAVEEAEAIAAEASAAAKQAQAAAMASLIAWIGIGITAIVAITGAIKQYQEKLHQQRMESIETWKQESENARQMNALLIQQKGLTTENEEYYNVEKQIVDLLGDKKFALEGVTEKTDEYTKAVNNLTEAERRRYRRDVEKAQRSAKKEVENLIIGENGTKIEGRLTAAGLGGYATRNAKKLVEGYHRLENVINSWFEKYKKAIREGDEETAQYAKSQYEYFSEGLDMMSATIDAYEDANRAKKQFASDDILIKMTEDEIEQLVAFGKVTDEVNNELKAEGITVDSLTKRYIESMSASQKAALAKTNAKMASFDFTKATKQEIQALIDEGVQMGATRAACTLLANAYASAQSYMTSILSSSVASRMGILQSELTAIKNVASAYALIAGKMGVSTKEAQVEVAELQRRKGQSNTAIGKQNTEAAQTYQNIVGLGQTMQQISDLVSGINISPVGGGTSGGGGGGGGSHGGGGGGGSGKSATDIQNEEIKRFEDTAKTEEERLNLMIHQNISREVQIEQMRKIQKSYSDVATYMRSIGRSEDEILKYSNQWWTWQEKINETIKGGYEEEISLLEDKATLMAHEGKSSWDMIDNLKQRNDLIHQEADWMRSVGYSEDEIIKLQNKHWDNQEAITDDYKQYYQNLIADTESEVNLLEKQGDKEEQIVAKKKEKQKILHDEAEYLRQVKKFYEDIGASAEKINEIQREINSLSAEWLDEDNNINEIYKSILEEQRDKELDAIQKKIDALKEEKEIEDEELEIEEKRLAVAEAAKKLKDAENQRNVRVYNAKTGQWEWRAKQSDIDSATKDLESAGKNYDDALKNKQISDLEKQKTSLEGIWSAIIDNKAHYTTIIAKMQEISAQWRLGDEEEREYYAKVNFALGSIIGAVRGDDGVWTKDGRNLYSYGNKTSPVTFKDKMIYPALTKNLLGITPPDVFRDYSRQLGLSYGGSQAYMTNGYPTYRNGGSVDYSKSYSVNGIPITQQMAQNNTIDELFRMMPFV